MLLRNNEQANAIAINPHKYNHRANTMFAHFLSQSDARWPLTLRVSCAGMIDELDALRSENTLKWPTVSLSIGQLNQNRFKSAQARC